MQILDKIKESNKLFTDYGETLSEINRVLALPVEKVSPSKLVSLYDKKGKIWKKRSKVLEELQVLCNKLNKDHQLKIEKCTQFWADKRSE